jgi:hypothetical protein
VFDVGEVAQGVDAAGFCDEFVPGVTTCVDDGVVVVEQSLREVALSQVKPDALDRVEFWAVGRERDEGDVGRDLDACAVPAGAVSTMTAWVSGGTRAEKSARKRDMAAVETKGRTRAKSSPVAGRTAAKM